MKSASQHKNRVEILQILTELKKNSKRSNRLKNFFQDLKIEKVGGYQKMLGFLERVRQLGLLWMDPLQIGRESLGIKASW